MCVHIFCRVFDKREFFRQNYDRELFAFKNRLGLSFQDDNNLVTALTHESYKQDLSTSDDESRPELLVNNAKLSLLGEL